jgi:hypothetical protein
MKRMISIYLRTALGGAARATSVGLATVCTLALVPVLATAQPRSADEWYKFGEDQYNLGNFEKAIDAFKKGFELEPDSKKKSAYLYNIAQSYRQAKNCFEAQFFYKRFLALRGSDINEQVRKEVEERIKELEECARQQEVIRNRPPDTTLRPEGDPTTPDPNRKPGDTVVGDTTQPDDDDDDPGITKSATVQPTLLSVRATGGGTKLNTGNLNPPVQATFALVGGYPLALGPQLTLDVGAAFTFTPVGYVDQMGAGQTAQMIGVMANAGATYAVAPKIGVRGDLGVGALVFGGINESPFTDFAPTSGALTMLHVRLGLSADYAITPNVVATLTPIAFSYSPAKEGLQTGGEEMSAITSIDFMVGIGYRM